MRTAASPINLVNTCHQPCIA